VIEHLPRLGPEPPGKPDGDNEDHPMRKVTRQVAFEPLGWTPERAMKVAELFDGLASGWHTRDHPHRLAPLADALARGGLPPGGVGIEVGSGTGMATPWLQQRFASLVPVDLSWEMLIRGTGPRVQADAQHLPFPSGAADAVVLVNMLLFPAEMARLVAPSGALVWVNTSGTSTPIHLTANEVDAALPGDWTGTASEAGWGTWAVLRRSA
jgi:hypothetical protein